MIRAVTVASLLGFVGCASSVAPSFGDSAVPLDIVNDGGINVGTDAVGAPDVARDTGVVDAGRVTYRNDFDDPSAAVPEWSSRTISRTPTGNRSFLGPIGRGVTQLTVDGWAPHRTMAVSLTLFVIGSWDGNLAGQGPDIWELRTRGSAPIVHTTFANLDGAEITQSFPDEFPAGRHRSGAGATSRDTLGYFYVFRQMNAVYRIVRRFPHTDPTLVLEFDSEDGEASNRDEEWGLDEIAIVADP